MQYSEELKVEAVRHVMDRGYSVPDVAQRLDVTTRSLYGWLMRHGEHADQFQEKQQDAELRRLKAELSLKY